MKNFVLGAAFAALACLAIPGFAQTQASVAAYDCAAQVDIPESECNALKNLFAATAGEQWATATNWGTGLPSNWAGVFAGVSDGGRHVITLRLNSNRLDGVLPSSLSDLRHLRTLELNHNRLRGAIPNSFGLLTRMRDLQIFNNQLTGGIPDIFMGWDSIIQIDFSNNPDLGGTLPATITSNGSLFRLSLAGIGLEGSIPAALGSLPALRTLDLSRNHLIGRIPDTFGVVAATPQNVNFAENQLDADPIGCALLTPALGAWSSGGSVRNLCQQRAAAPPPPPPPAPVAGATAQAVPALPLGWLLLLAGLCGIAAGRHRP